MMAESSMDFDKFLATVESEIPGFQISLTKMRTLMKTHYPLALAALKDAHEKRTGCTLTAEMVDALGLSEIGDIWRERIQDHKGRSTDNG